MTSPASIAGRLAAVVLAVLLATAGLATPASAAPSGLAVSLSAAKGSVTVDLSGVQYAATPDWLRIVATPTSCGGVAPCWTAQDGSLYVSHGFTGTYTLTGLHGDTVYRVDVVADGVGSFSGTATTPKDLNLAPSDGPLVAPAADGLSVSITPQPETSEWSLNDGTPIAKLTYDVYANVGGARLKRVLTNVAAGSAHTVTGLPLHRAITFSETEVNSVGESPETMTPGGWILGEVAPGAFDGTWRTSGTKAAIQWSAAAPGAGRITKYVVTVLDGSKRVFSRTTGGAVHAVAVSGLRRRSSFTTTVTATNTYGISTTITGTLVTT